MTDTTKEPRTIDLTPTWPEAARIIAAALENGTGQGRDAARSELFRMAQIIEHLTGQLKAAEDDLATATERLRQLCDPYPVDENLFALDSDRSQPAHVFDVLATSKAGGSPYGVSFTSQTAAIAYSAIMEGAGYTVEEIGDYIAKPTAAEGLADAAEFFGDPAIRPAEQVKP